LRAWPGSSGARRAALGRVRATFARRSRQSDRRLHATVVVNATAAFQELAWYTRAGWVGEQLIHHVPSRIGALARRQESENFCKPFAGGQNRQFVDFALTWAFVGVGLWLSSVARTSERATVYVLLAWLGTTALHDFGLIALLLRFKLLPAVVFASAAVNPAEAGRLAILTGIDPELSVLGPVGFWLATTLGPQLTLLIGLGRLTHRTDAFSKGQPKDS
jgi:hypothetical protein